MTTPQQAAALAHCVDRSLTDLECWAIDYALAVAARFDPTATDKSATDWKRT